MARIGFIGCGNMGGALAKAAAVTAKEEVLIYDPMGEKTAALAQECGATQSTAGQIAKSAKFVVLGVKPQNFEEVVSGLSASLSENVSPIIVTMAAGVSIAAVRRFAGVDYPVIRIMPNTPCMLGSGAVLYATSDVSKEEEEEFLSIMKASGEFFSIKEELIDAAGALSGCGPAYYYMYANGLAQGAEALGVDRETAIRLAAQTMIGAGKMLLAYGDPVDLKNKVCSPGGTTLAGVAALEKGNLEEVAASAVDAAYVRTLELKK